MKMSLTNVVAFIRESNRIEGLYHEPTETEIAAFYKVISAEVITPAILMSFVSDTVRGGKLRIEYGDNVRVGRHVPIAGGPVVLDLLRELLRTANTDKTISPYDLHNRYLHLHPFTDGNGRSSRVLFAWHSLKRGQREFIEVGFLREYYYQTLQRYDQQVLHGAGLNQTEQH